MDNSATIPHTEAPDRADAVEKAFVRNATAGVVFEGTWSLGMAFATSSVIIPTYLVSLGAPRWLIGLASSLPVLCSPLQLFSEGLAGGPKRRRNIWIIYTMCSLCYVVIALLSWPIENATARMAIFVTLMGGFFACHALCFTMYQAILTDNCPLRRRGQMFGYRMAAMGLVGLPILPIASRIVGRWSEHGGGEPKMYLASMFIGGCFFAVSSLSPWMFRDRIDPRRGSPERRRPGLILVDAAKLLKKLWYTPNYRVFIFFAMVLTGGTSLGTFIVTAARDTLPADAATAGPQVFQYWVLAAFPASGVFVAGIADRWGYQLTLALTAVIALAGFVTASLASSMTAMLIAYALMMVAVSSIPAAVGNLSIELVPDISAAQLIAGANVMCLPVNLLMPFICGLVLDSARVAGVVAWGYYVVFALAGAMVVVAGVGTLVLIQEPRTGRVYEIKVIHRG